jgi:GGDEF domain-containing protein
MPKGKDIRLDAVYRVLARSEVFPIVRELLIGLLSFLLIIAILIIIQPYIAAKTEKRSPAVGSTEKGTDTQGVETPIAANNDIVEDTEREAGQAVMTAEENAGEAELEKADAGGLYSPETELVREQYLEERLSAELKRAASFDQDLVLLLACVDGLTRSDGFYQRLSQIAQEFFTFQDLCFEYSDGGVGIIIPNLDIDDGIERAESFKSRVDLRLQKDGVPGQLSAGLSSRNGRLISGKRIIREARSALRRAAGDSSGIVAFRVDPEKYREYIASQKSSTRR